mmetsp:Transcript_10413/g.31228  ORF Transcript_10413/g.31228 Transcript_10413/m.31228 type:complete len:247 (-) Transcript_10413:1832-2572(-)
MDTSVNAMLKQAGADFRLEAAAGCPAAWADEVTLAHLIDHTGLGMHYVNGVPRTVEMPAAISLIKGEHSEDLGYERILVHKKPGVTFGYSGGGFLVLQTLLEALESRSIEDIMRPFLDSVGMRDFSFVQRENLPGVPYATGYFDDGSRVPGGRLMYATPKPKRQSAPFIPDPDRSLVIIFPVRLIHSPGSRRSPRAVSDRRARWLTSGAICWMPTQAGRAATRGQYRTRRRRRCSRRRRIRAVVTS